MTDEALEALNRVYTGWWCVPLASGRIAVFTHPSGTLHAIVNTWADVLTLARPLRVVAQSHHLDLVNIKLDL